ncbi:RNase H [Clostridium homopropionicum DSM 5847]|uniref:RNase H n=1 Tax=Clostridium homopropionicum DSM 5847 TaxID=1121318 RepID=A0A0L6Z8T9_9CLOT|nr:ribonuclease H family protein [Clostridium homopropionicum]KOA19385.1 RNase H [Clostridium homopropionicum DSM 5847]SFG68151.1 ribonuclease HI [Clostridium homopropionicum]
MAKKFYAIKEGFDFQNKCRVENMIVDTWDECVKYVKGAKGSKYKSFSNILQAKEYLNAGASMVTKQQDEYPKDIPLFYVDGSYNELTERYSYAFVAVKEEVIIEVKNGASEDNSFKAIRQIAGELEASIKAIEYSIEKGYKDIIILHDYVGVCYHATGEWERKEESSKRYYDKYNKLIKENGININFIKVNSHTGNLFNEITDEFAKAAINVNLKGETKKYLKSNCIKVLNNNIKNAFKDIVGEELIENIVVCQ